MHKYRPTDRTTYAKHTYGHICKFSTFTTNLELNLLFPSKKSFVLSCDLHVNEPFWYP